MVKYNPKNYPTYKKKPYSALRIVGSMPKRQFIPSNAVAVVKRMPGSLRTGGFYGRYNSRPGNENKFFDTANSFLIDQTGEVPATGQLVLIPQGTTESTRIGRKCVIKSIQIRGVFTFIPGAAATASQVSTVVLVWDKQCNGAAAAVTDVMTSNALGTALVNMANSERFVILKRWRITLQPGAGVTTAYNNTSRSLDYFKKCNIPIEYNSTAGAITEIRSNNLFLLAGADTNGGDDVVQFLGTTRVRYSDM